MDVDSVVQEVREIREAYAKLFEYDLRAIHLDLKERERARPHGRVVSATAS
jgi:hypothetical protein